MKLEEHIGPLGGVIRALENDPSADPVTVIAAKVALVDISERLQRLEVARGVLIELLGGLQVTAPNTDAHRAYTSLLEEITADPLEVSQ